MNTPLTRRHNARRSLYIGLAVSLLVHCLALAIRFDPPASAKPVTSTLEVVLLNAYDGVRPVDPAALAQADMDGGGEQEHGIARSPLPPSAAPTVLPGGAPLRDQVDQQARDLLLQPASPVAVASKPAGAPAQPAAITSKQPGDAADIAALTQQYAAIAQRIDDYNRRPRRHFFAPSTSASRYAQYVETWREHVEHVGNDVYAATVPAGIYGSLRLTVFVRADGSVERLEFDTPSVHAQLNQAARDIVRQSAPFAPFPDAIRHDTDVMAITRTWHFENDSLSTEQQ